MKLALKIAAVTLCLLGTAFADTYLVKPGDTLSGLLADRYRADEIAAIARDIKAQAPEFVLRSGMQMERSLEEVTIHMAADKEVRIYREGHLPTVSIVKYEQEILPTVVSGRITTSLFAAVKDAGEDVELAAMLARMYEWKFDFFKDIRLGDTFTVLVEKKFVKDRYVGYGRILAANFRVKDQNHKAFYYSDGKNSGYFDEEGTSLERGFLRVPLSYTRISSRFSTSRMHPVLGYERPHYGVDFAAPTGTPVMATAHGKITKMSYTKSNGNYIELTHTNGYKTYYLHLNGFAKHLKVGSQVNQSQVIGYVGSTGLATGPHLDYRISHKGTWLDPLKFVAESPKLEGKDKEVFLQVAARHDNVLTLGYQYAAWFQPSHLQ